MAFGVDLFILVWTSRWCVYEDAIVFMYTKRVSFFVIYFFFTFAADFRARKCSVYLMEEFVFLQTEDSKASSCFWHIQILTLFFGNISQQQIRTSWFRLISFIFTLGFYLHEIVLARYGPHLPWIRMRLDTYTVTVRTHDGMRIWRSQPLIQNGRQYK